MKTCYNKKEVFSVSEENNIYLVILCFKIYFITNLMSSMSHGSCHRICKLGESSKSCTVDSWYFSVVTLNGFQHIEYTLFYIHWNIF